MSIREKYNIPQEAKVLLYVGNISRNKNQVQMVRAYSRLPEVLQKNTWVLFCGKNAGGDASLEKLIERGETASHLVLCGGIDREKMEDFYHAADGVVLLSYAEGFGLSLIEGMHFGLPCVMPNDLDAYEDIYSPVAVVAISDRSDEAAAEGIRQLLSRGWDKKGIRSYSARFASQTMAQNYINVYKHMVNE